MIDFEAIVKSAIADGMSLEEIGENLAKALNDIQEENKWVNEREDYIFHLNEIWEDSHPGFDGAAMEAALTAAEEHTEWTAETIKYYYETARETLKMLASMVDNNAEQMAKNIVDKVTETIAETTSKEDAELLDNISKLLNIFE